MKKKTLLVTTIASALLLSTPSWAHRAWIKPDTTVISQANSWIAFDAAISNDIFGFDHFAMNLETVQALNPEGGEVELQNAAKAKARSTFDLLLTEEGTYKVFTSSRSLQARWVDESGNNKFWPGRGVVASVEDFEAQVPKSATDLVVTDFSRRVETFVTAGAPTKGTVTPKGEGFEIAFIEGTHPNDLYHGEPTYFQFLIDGEAAVGAKIEIVPAGIRYRDQPNEILIETDAEGKFEVIWPDAGQYFMEVSYTDEKAKAPAHVRRGGYSAVFEVL